MCHMTMDVETLACGIYRSGLQRTHKYRNKLSIYSIFMTTTANGR